MCAPSATEVTEWSLSLDFLHNIYSIAGTVGASGALTCKGDYVLFRDTANGIIGCYQLFYPNEEGYSWHRADTFCRNNSYAGESGMLAASRSEREQAFLISLANDAETNLKIWLAGNSLQSDNIWRWSGYQSHVDWLLPHVTVNTIPLAPPNNYPNRAILNGHIGAYRWSLQPSSQRHAFVCRKDGQHAPAQRGFCLS